MHRPGYEIGRAMVRFVSGMYVRHRPVHSERLRRTGPYILACTHVGHLEPLIIGTLLERQISWLAREEFFRVRVTRSALNCVGAIRVDRRGVPVAAIRESIRRLHDGEIIGIFPEGGRTHGDAQVIRGGAIKGGTCLIALRAGVPIVPVVMLGTDALHSISPWVPGQRTTVRTIVGEAMRPPVDVGLDRQRHARHALTAELAAAFVRLHDELISSPAVRR